MRYNSSQIINNAGAVYANKRWIPTYAYAIDPVLGSTAMPGFSEMQGLYRYYRVRQFRTTASVVNREAFAIQAWMCPSNGDPGANTASYQNYISNRRAKVVALGQNSGNSRGTLTLPWVSVSNFGGSASTNVNDDYATSTSTQPTNNIYVGVGVSTDGTVLAGGCYVTITHDIELDFFEPASPST